MALSEFTVEDVFITTKTYPTPSQRYRETSCVAGINTEGKLRRLFPVPFRLLCGERQFKRWEKIRVRTSLKSTDRRPESRKIEIDSIERLEEVLDTKNGWSKRLQMVAPHLVTDPDALEERRKETKESLGFVKPTRCVGLDITKVDDPEWTAEELAKLSADGLFDSDDVRNRTSLRKLPFDFHYRYECATSNGPKTFRHKVTDWEFGALFWTCVKSHGLNGWETPFRAKVEQEFFEKRQLLFMLGTINQYPNRWLIVGVMYPPTPPPPSQTQQLDLGLGL